MSRQAVRRWLQHGAGPLQGGDPGLRGAQEEA